MRSSHLGKVSTIIPVYNRACLLIEAVDSVLAQTYQNIEIIIVDDGSDDDTPEAIASLAKRSTGNVRIIAQSNLGPGAAREAGLQESGGEYVQFLDSDDLLLPKKFELQVAALNNNPHCDVAYGKTAYWASGQKQPLKPWKRTGEHIRSMFPSFLQSRWWGTSTPLYRKQILDVAGPWLDLRNEEDWEYDCRLASLGVELCYCDAFVSIQRGHSGERLSTNGSTDPNKLRDRAAAHEIIYRHATRHGLTSAAPEMQHFSRELFLLARQCGATGLQSEAKILFNLARAASGQRESKGPKFRLYELLASSIGWSRAGKLACKFDKIRAQFLRT